MESTFASTKKRDCPSETVGLYGLSSKANSDRETIRRFLHENPTFVSSAFAAHKVGFLLCYLSAKGIHHVTPRDVDYYQLLIIELFEHPLFKYDMAAQVRDGFRAAAD